MYTAFYSMFASLMRAELSAFAPRECGAESGLFPVCDKRGLRVEVEPGVCAAV